MPLFNSKLKQENTELREAVDTVTKENIELRETNQTLTMGGVTIPVANSYGQYPNRNNVLKIATTHSCLNLIVNTIATLPIDLYKEDNDGNVEKIKKDKRVKLLNDENEENMNATTFKKMFVSDYILEGQGFAYMRYKEEPSKFGESKSTLVELNHLPAKSMVIANKGSDGIKYTDVTYQLTAFDSTDTKNQRTFKPRELVRIVNNPKNGNPFEGEGVLVRGQRIFQQALNEMDYTEGLLERGALPLGILKAKARLQKSAIDLLRASWNNLYSGAKNSAKTVVLEEGMDYEKLQMNPDEIQLTQTTKNTTSKICELFGVPESMVVESAKKYGTVEANMLNFLQNCLLPILRDIESSFDRQLLTEKEKENGYYFRFNIKDLLRATSKEHSDTILAQVNGGLITVNEARYELDLSKVENGDELKQSLGHVFHNTKTGEKTVPNTGEILTKTKKEDVADDD